MKTKKQSKKAELIQLVQYSIVGGAWFWSGYAMFALCDQVFGLNLWWSKLIANLFGLSVNFLLQRIWVFARNQQKVQKLNVVTSRYVILTIVNLFVDYLIIRVLKDTFSVSPYVGQFVAAGFFWGWNYLWYRYWVFAQSSKRKV